MRLSRSELGLGVVDVLPSYEVHINGTPHDVADHLQKTAAGYDLRGERICRLKRFKLC